MHRGGDGSRLPINNLTKLVPADGSGPVLQTPQCSLAAIWGTNSVDSENVSATRYISRMAKGKRETEWEVIRLKATPAALVGLVQAPDKATALNAAIERFNIRREDQSRLLIRPR